MLGINLITPVPWQVFNSKTIDLPANVQIVVHITLSCGAPACVAGGIPRNTSSIRIRGAIEKPDGSCMDIPLKFTGNVAEFQGMMHVASKGRYSLLIEASDPDSGSTGRLVSGFAVK